MWFLLDWWLSKVFGEFCLQWCYLRLFVWCLASWRLGFGGRSIWLSRVLLRSIWRSYLIGLWRIHDLNLLNKGHCLFGLLFWRNIRLIILFLIRLHYWFLCWNTNFRCLTYARRLGLWNWCLVFERFPLRLFNLRCFLLLFYRLILDGGNRNCWNLRFFFLFLFLSKI